jgi:hypothetical protein
MQADLMKLIAYGKVMEDDAKALKDYSIKEGDFLVVMISKVSSQYIHHLLGKATAKAKRRSENGRASPIAATITNKCLAESTSHESIITQIITTTSLITAITTSWGFFNS